MSLAPVTSAPVASAPIALAPHNHTDNASVKTNETSVKKVEFVSNPSLKTLLGELRYYVNKHRLEKHFQKGNATGQDV